MDKEEIARIISKNLKRIAYEHGKTQSDISRDLQINKATLSTWMTGLRIPRMPTVDRLCEYFGCTRADILEPYEPQKRHPFSLDASEVELIRAYRTAPQDMKAAVHVLLGIKKKGKGEQAEEMFSA